jgi:hypothetical protein
MTVLTAAARKRLPKSVYALPELEKYPITDLKHAAVAKSYAKQELDNGNLTEAQYRRVIAAANAYERLHGAMKGSSQK